MIFTTKVYLVLFCQDKELEYNKTKRALATPAQWGNKTCKEVLSWSVPEQSSVFSAGANALPPSPGQQRGKGDSCTPLPELYLRCKQNVSFLRESRYVKKQQSALRISMAQSSPLTAVLQLHFFNAVLEELTSFGHQVLFQTPQILENMKHVSGESEESSFKFLSLIYLAKCFLCQGRVHMQQRWSFWPLDCHKQAIFFSMVCDGKFVSTRLIKELIKWKK